VCVFPTRWGSPYVSGPESGAEGIRTPVLRRARAIRLFQPVLACPVSSMFCRTIGGVLFAAYQVVPSRLQYIYSSSLGRLTSSLRVICPWCKNEPQSAAETARSRSASSRPISAELEVRA
jgi:hypothetical protein